MTNKVLIIGPPNTGKSTLRKVFFEGENVINLLNNPLECTYGAETYLYKLSEEIAVVDLAGQELNRWLNFEQSVFIKADMILIIFDSRSKFEECQIFINEIDKIRKKHCKSAHIYGLFHKIDLIDKKTLNSLRTMVKTKLKKISNFSAYLTSISEEFYLETFNVFLEILNLAQKKHLVDFPYNLAAVKANALFFSKLMDDKVVDLKEMSSLMSISKNKLISQIDQYEKGELIKTKKMGNVLAVFLTEKGEIFNSTIVKNFFNIQKIENENGKNFIGEGNLSENLDLGRINEKGYVDELIPGLIYGFIISDDNGRTLLIYESNENNLYNRLNTDNNPNFDLELVPMFISAMQKFSMEINIQGFSGFRMQGTNIKVNSIYRDEMTFTIFSCADINPELMKDDFSELFDQFLLDYEDQIENFIRTGNATLFQSFASVIKTKLYDIIQNYLKTTYKPVQSRDFTNKEILPYKELYQQLNTINEIKSGDEVKITRNELKSLKMNMFKAILAENIYELKKITEKVYKFLPKFPLI